MSGRAGLAERMSSLRARVLLAVAATALALVLGLYLPLERILLGSFRELEEDDAVRNATRALNAIADDAAYLARTARDYATWDETYEFIRTRDPRYVEVNYVDQTFIQNRLSLLVVASLEGEVLYAKGFDIEARKELEVRPSLDLFPPAERALLPRRETGEGVSGLVLLQRGPMLVAALPVVASTGEGPVRGTLIMGRELNAHEIGRIAAGLRLSMSLHGYTSADPRLVAAQRAISDARPVHVERLDERTIAATAPLEDMLGRPALLLRLEMPRDVWQRGRAADRYLILSLLLAAVLFAAVISAVLERLVLRRLARLSREVAEIGAQGDLALRVGVEGRDELTALARGMNEMLESLERLNRLLQAERDRSESLLLNILPKPIADRLKLDPGAIADHFAEVTVLFSDIVGFTTLSARVGARELVDMLNEIFSAFDRLAEKHGLEKIKTIGDAYMVVAGLPEPRPDHAPATARMALDMLAEIDKFNAARGTALGIRVGINSGPVVAGVIGKKKFIYDIWGDAVNTASRMESSGVPGRVQVSETTRALLEARFELEERGSIQVKGKGEMRTWLLVRERAAAAATVAP